MTLDRLEHYWHYIRFILALYRAVRFCVLWLKAQIEILTNAILAPIEDAIRIGAPLIAAIGTIIIALDHL